MSRVLLSGLCAISLLGMAAEPVRRIQITEIECTQRGRTSACLLRLPPGWMRDMVVDVPSRDQDVGFRLYEGRLGSWELEAEGVWHAGPVSRRSLRVIGALIGGPIRLELTGAVRPPRLTGITVTDREPVRAGPGPLRDDPRSAPEPSRAGFSSENAWFPAAWPVRAEGARPGETVRLELPDEVLDRLGRLGLWGVHMATPEGQIPWTYEIGELPRPGAELIGAQWVPADRPGWLRLSIPDLRKGPAYTEIHLTAPPRPLLRRVAVAGLDEILWRCVPTPPLPCRLAVHLPVFEGEAPRELPEVEMQGGEDAPLPSLDVSVWRRTEQIVFTWPARGPVRLLAGNDEISETGSLLETDPRARPWKRTALGPEERGPQTRWWRLGSAGFATLVLVGLCLREVRRRRWAAALLLALLPVQARGTDLSIERRQEASGLPRETVEPQGPVGEDFRIAAEWPVHAPRTAPRGVVRLELPAEVYLRGGSLDRLRLESGGRQIPYVLHTQDVPVPVARGRISPGRNRSVSFAASPLLPLIAWRLETRAPVSAWFMSERWSVGLPTGNGQWDCVPASQSPCVLDVGYDRMPYQGKAPPVLEASGKFGEIEVTLLRQRHELVFVWPEEGAVRLLAGPKGSSAPMYDLHAVQDQLLARSWQPARLGPVEEHPASGPFRQAFLGAAALVLLFAVHRLMPRRSQQASP